jgi:hypothetical protein
LRFFPRSPLTFRIVSTAIESFAAAGLLENDLAFAFGTSYSLNNVFVFTRIFTFGESGTA